MTPKGFFITICGIVIVAALYAISGLLLDGRESSRNGASCNHACVAQGYDKGHAGVDPLLYSYCLCKNNREKYLTKTPQGHLGVIRCVGRNRNPGRTDKAP